MAEVSDLIGTPFVYGGRGPDSFDCYGLVMHLYRTRLGIELPDYNSPTDQAVIAAVMGTQLPLWEPVPCAADTVVLLRLARHACHVGYMLDAHTVMHTAETTGGVITQRIDAWERRILGFHRYVG